jgi:diaminopropionate ammonia-lyase
MTERLVLNPRVDRHANYPQEYRPILSLAAGRAAREAIAAWPGYAPTPLHLLDRQTRALELGAVLYKNEDRRFGLHSFKALGGAYAVERIVRAGGGKRITVCSATDGNHGRSVAWGAQRAGCGCVIYIHEKVSEGRAAAIRAFGAEVRRVAGNYDDSVRRAAEDSHANGWTVVSDTSWDGYDEIPRDVMQGYAVMIAEALEQGAAPTHVLVQGGVGGVAAAVVAQLWESIGASRPRVVVVEPTRADCLTRSAELGRMAHLTGDLDTIMAGLSCGEPSPLAWTILDRGADAFLAIDDARIAPAMRELATQGIVGGESGVAGLAGLDLVARDSDHRCALGLDSMSRVLLFGTEGATDPALYQSIVGRSADSVRGVAG